MTSWVSGRELVLGPHFEYILARASRVGPDVDVGTFIAKKHRIAMVPKNPILCLDFSLTYIEVAWAETRRICNFCSITNRGWNWD